MTSKAIGSVALVRPGCEVWSKTRTYSDHGTVSPVGGIVLYETETRDRETGDIARSFLVVDPTRHRAWQHRATLAELDIDPATAQSVDVSVLVRLWRVLAGEIAYSSPGHPRRGPATADEARLAEAVLTLVRLVFGPEGLLHGAIEPPKPAQPVDPLPVAPVATAALVD